MYSLFLKYLELKNISQPQQEELTIPSLVEIMMFKIAQS